MAAECFMCYQEFPENAYLKTGYHKQCFFEGTGVPTVGGRRCYTLKEWDELQKSKQKGGPTPGEAGGQVGGEAGGVDGGEVGGQVGGGNGGGWGLGLFSGKGVDLGLGDLKKMIQAFIFIMILILIFNLIRK